MAIRMGIRELRDTLTQTIRRVRAGETIEVTNDGELVAVISPYRRSKLEQLIAEGKPLPDGRSARRSGCTRRRDRRPRPRSSKRIALAVERLFYADSSALVKLFVRESESAALVSFVPRDATLVSSAMALVEVTRTVRDAGLEDEVEGGLESLLDDIVLIDIDRSMLSRAAALTSATLRSLDAIHLSTAVHIEPEAILVYDRGLRQAAGSVGLRVEAPGALPA